MTIQYIHNVETTQTLFNILGNWDVPYMEPSPWGKAPKFKYPWREATQEEIDEKLFFDAKSAKVSALKTDREAFLDAGYTYTGTIANPEWVNTTSYEKNALVTGSDSQAYRSLQSDNLDHDPISSPDWWKTFFPTFRLTSDVITNIDAKCRLAPDAPDRYKFYDKSDETGYRDQIDFGDLAGWDAFVSSILTEEDRVMRKYNVYRQQIAECATVAEVDAIVIDFNA